MKNAFCCLSILMMVASISRAEELIISVTGDQGPRSGQIRRLEPIPISIVPIGVSELPAPRKTPGNLLTDGGFEYPDHKGAAYIPHGKGPLGAWVVENGTVDIVGPYWRASRGKQSLDLSGMQEMPGTISQAIETNPNEYYKIRFVVSANPEPADRHNPKKMKVSWGDKELRTITVSAKRHDFHNVGWKIYEFTVRGTDGLSQLKFQSLTNTPCGPILDDISVSHLPNHKPIKK
ncbi:MAG: hypothetical protein COA78_05930 [Blastopirellula sp.]|nr:MAG: hypothetical protein COA78_05930 [Blastopirellula sp.]